MKYLVSAVLFLVSALSQSVWAADGGPYYVSYTGYCNVKRVYVDPSDGVFGTEVGCPTTIGTPLAGMLVNGMVIVGLIGPTYNSVCFNMFTLSNLAMVGGCSAYGGPINYSTTNGWTIQEAGTPARPQFTVSTEAPDLESIKNLPPFPG